ncbi:MAG: hypothetical protein ACRBBJ_10465 [Rhodomicrobiaceae bacterium]
MQKIITFALMLFISTTAVMADPTDKMVHDAQNKFQNELSRCGVFYEILAGCLSDEDAQKNKITTLSKKTIQQAIKLGLKVDIKIDKILAGLRQERASLISVIEGECANYSVIVEQHYANCTNVSKMAEKLVKNWDPKHRGSAAE